VGLEAFDFEPEATADIAVEPKGGGVANTTAPLMDNATFFESLNVDTTYPRSAREPKGISSWKGGSFFVRLKKSPFGSNVLSLLSRTQTVEDVLEKYISQLETNVCPETRCYSVWLM